MSPTHSSTSSRFGPRARSIVCLLAMLAAVSACADSGNPGEEQEPEPTSQVQPGENENEPGENENEPGENENEPGENENEPGENEEGGDQP